MKRVARINPGVSAMVIALPNPGGKEEGRMARRNMSYRKRRNSAARRNAAAKKRTAKRGAKKKASAAMNEGLARNSRLLKQARNKGYKGKKRTTAHLENWLAAHKEKKSGGSSSTSKRPKRRRRTVRSLVGSARRRTATRRKRTISRGPNKGKVRPGRPSVAADLRRIAKRVSSSDRDLARAMRQLAAKKGKRRARKNPSGKEIGMGAVGFIGGYAIEQTLAGLLRKPEFAQTPMARKAVEIGVPVVGSFATWALHKKGMLGLASPTVAYSVIGGMVGGALARNVGAIRNLVSKVPGLSHLANLGQENGSAFGAFHYYAGAAGVGRYVTSGALGRYMLDDTAFRGAGMSGVGASDLHAGAAGVGEYVSEPAVLDGLGGMQHDNEMDELMEELGSIPVLTPDMEQAENILIPELAYESLQGLHGALGQDPKATLRARSSAPIIRTTPNVAAKLDQYNIGEVLGPSSQVPGTVLVASSVAGRDIIGGAGPFIPTQQGAFKNPAIEPAKDITTSPYGVFSRGVFSSTLPVHGAISR